jgi:hypothetical protein
MKTRPLFRVVAGLAAFWATGWMLVSRGVRPRRADKHPAIAPDDPAADSEQGPTPVRSAGPESMRNGDGLHWDKVDEASDGSFPASDPPSTLKSE